MSSQKKSKLDLLLRVRFPNPIPPPSFPPLLLDIPPNLPRLARTDYIAEYAAAQALPMVVDGEGGMRVDMNEWEGVWWGDLNAINPSTPIPSSSHHPIDALLLQPPSLPSSDLQSSAPALPGIFASSNIHTRVAAGTLRQTLHKPDRSWLRNTTYLQARSSAPSAPSPARPGASGIRKLGAGKSKDEDEIKGREIPDDSMFAQLQMIEKSFFLHAEAVKEGGGVDRAEGEEKGEVLRHPEKRGLVMVDSFEILPNEETFANEYNWVVFPERPVEAGDDKPISDPRLAASILRPQKVTDKKLFMELFVPSSDEEMEELERVRREVMQTEEDREKFGEGMLEKPCEFKYIRDYDYNASNTDPSAPAPENCYILTFSSGVAASSPEQENVVASPGEVKDDEDDDDGLFGSDDDDDKPVPGPTVSKAGGPVTTDSAAAGVETGGKRKRVKEKGVYWTPVNRRLVAKKRRIAKDEHSDKTDAWDIVHVRYEEPSQQLLEAREEAAELVMDEDWVSRWLRGGEEGENDMIGEGEGEDLG